MASRINARLGQSTIAPERQVSLEDTTPQKLITWFGTPNAFLRADITGGTMVAMAEKGINTIPLTCTLSNPANGEAIVTWAAGLLAPGTWKIQAYLTLNGVTSGVEWSERVRDSIGDGLSVPAVMDAPAVTALSPTLITVNAAPLPASGGSPITGINLRYSDDEVAWATIEYADDPQQIPDLDPNTQYWAQTQAINAVGVGPWSESGTVTTPLAAPVAAGAIDDVEWTEGEAITALDVSADFTGTSITYALAPGSASMPDGLNMDTAGTIAGTPTTEASEVNIIVRGTNSGGYDDTAFGATVVAAAGAGIALTSIDGTGWRVTPDSYPGTIDPEVLFFTATGPGHDASGAYVAAKTRTIKCGAEVPDWDDYTLDSANGTEIVASRRVYSGEILSSGTNSSAVPYKPAHAVWLMPDQQTQNGTSLFVRLLVNHREAQFGKPVAAVEFTVTDHLSGEATLVVTTPTAVQYTASGLYAGSVYEGTVDLSGLDDNSGQTFSSSTPNKLTIGAKVRPWVGPEQDLADTYDGTTANAWRELTYLNNIGGWRPKAYAYVDVGAVGGTVSTTEATAEAAPFPTVVAASTALRNYYNGLGRGVLDNSEIVFEPGTHTMGQWAHYTCDAGPITLRPKTPGDKSTTIIVDDGTTVRSQGRKLRVEDLSHVKSGDGSRVHYGSSTASDADYIALINCDLDVDGYDSAGQFAIDYGAGIYAENCTQVGTYGSSQWQIGCNGQWGRGGRTQGMIACTTDSYLKYNPGVSNDTSQFEGTIMAFNFISQDPDDVGLSGPEFHMTGTDDCVRGFTLLGNLFESKNFTGIGDNDGPYIRFSADGSTNETDNILMFGNTVPYGRAQGCYTDVAGAANKSHDAVFRGNIWTNWTVKSGTYFGPQAEANNGNWGPMLNVDGGYDCIRRGSAQPSNSPLGYTNWDGATGYPGKVSGEMPGTELSVNFTDDKSGPGVGGGDYSLSSQGDVPLVPGEYVWTNVDLYGTAIPLDGSATAGAVQ